MGVNRRKAARRLKVALLAGCAGASVAIATAAQGQDLRDVMDLLGRGSIPSTSSIANWIGDGVAQVLTRSEGAMPGDRRLARNGSGLALTRSEQDRANDAAVLFQDAVAMYGAPVDVRGVSGDAPRLTAEHAADVGAVVRKFGASRAGMVSANAEVRRALTPFLAVARIEQAWAVGLVGWYIPAEQVIRQYIVTYCIDPHLPTPRSGELFQLVSAKTLLPDVLLPSYLGLLRLGAERGRGYDSGIQGLIWTLRKTALGHSIGQVVNLSSEQQQTLTQADPNGLNALQTYYTRAQGRKLLADAISNGARQMAGSSGIQQISSISNSSAVRNVEQLAQQLSAAPLVGSVRGQNAGYSLLDDDIAAHSYSTSGGMRSAVIEVANRGAKPAIFAPATCVGQSTRPAQRLGLQPENALSRAAASGRRTAGGDASRLAFCSRFSTVCRGMSPSDMATLNSWWGEMVADEREVPLIKCGQPEIAGRRASLTVAAGAPSPRPAGQPGGLPQRSQGNGFISGEFSYPSEYFPDDLRSCAENIATKRIYCSVSKQGAGSAYSLMVPSGTYYVYAETRDFPGKKAYFTDHVTCGATVDCSSHEKVAVTVRAGRTTKGVDPQDWYD